MNPNYDYNYHVGLYISRNGKIDLITPEDLIKYYMFPHKIIFKPIPLTIEILKAFKFMRIRAGRYQPRYFRDPITLARVPGTSNNFYCTNTILKNSFKYLHELQDFYFHFNPFKCHELADFMDFITIYGSKYLRNCDKE
jgi:hypothetical protein